MKRRHSESPSPSPTASLDDPESTDTKLALLLSLHPSIDLSTALEALLASNGSVSVASASFSRPRKHPRQQASLSSFLLQTPSTPAVPKIHTPKKGDTLHLYTPSAITAAPCPAELLTSFLPVGLAESLLRELLHESSTFPPPPTFRLFNREVMSPHTSGFFLRNLKLDAGQYLSYQSQPLEARAYTPSMLAATQMVEAAVNAATNKRYAGMKPWGVSPQPWHTNAALVNRYQGTRQSVGWHTDDATYLGPMAVIAGLSLGVEREFRVRRVISPGRKGGDTKENDDDDDSEGAYALHLPHNSLLIMHAGMQEGWKHCVHPARNIDIHPVSGDVRISITYRCYRPSMKPEDTPKCKCKIPTILKAVFGNPENPQTPRRYFWGCSGKYRPEGDGLGCDFFRWAEFDGDGDPLWGNDGKG